MKALRSPWVSGALVILAVAVFLYQFRQPRRAQPRPAPAQAPAPVARLPKIKVPLPAVPAATNAAVLPALGIDRAYAESHLAEWADSPQRDPFFLIPVVSDKPVHQSTRRRCRIGNSKASGARRGAAWRPSTTGSIRRARASKVTRLSGLKTTRFWFQGPERMERLGFEPDNLGKGSSPPEARPGKPPGSRPAGNTSGPR